MKAILVFAAFVALGSSLAHAKEIKTNALVIPDAPGWLTPGRIDTVVGRIQHRLEWTIRRVKVDWYADGASFEKVHGLGARALAVTMTTAGVSSIHMGPRVTSENFDEVLGHELVHVISSQKYKGAIPKWLEEGLANHIAHRGKVDYKWLASQPLPDDVRDLAHPFSGSEEGIHYRYMASQAFAEMLNKSCDLDNLIRLSVQRNMEDYIKRYCRIADMNKSFKDWVTRQAAQ